MSNIRPYVIINGVDSRTIQGLLITSLPPISKPAQRTLTETIDGRDGDSSVKLGYSAYDKSLGIALTFNYNVDDIISFFNSEGTIVFSNEPDKLYNFEIFEAIDFEKLIRFKTATVTIHTQPFKFSTTENPLEFTEKEFTVVNNGNTDSRPNLVITGEGLATMQINGKNALNIDFGDAEQTLLIDSEGMNAYYTKNIKSIEAEIVPKQDLHGFDSPFIDSDVVNKVPYLSRALAGTAERIGNYEFNKLVGGTVAFNQLIKNSNAVNIVEKFGLTMNKISEGFGFTVSGTFEIISGDRNAYVYSGNPHIKITEGRVYLVTNTSTKIKPYLYGVTWAGNQYNDQDNKGGVIVKAVTSGNLNMSYYCGTNITNGTVFNETIRNNIFDLTAMFGATIADYIYSLEQATAGAGVAYFKALGFNKDYYPYNTGELMSVKTSAHVTKNAGGAVIQTVALDPNLELRGVPKLDANNKLYYDGDTYSADGSVSRKYGIVDLGSLNYTYDSSVPRFYTTGITDIIAGVDNEKANIISKFITISAFDLYSSPAMDCIALSSGKAISITNSDYTDASAFKATLSGVYLVYEKATPTSESADAFNNPIEIDANGSEEFTDSRAVAIPVGHESYYANICDIEGFTEVNLVRAGVNLNSGLEQITIEASQTSISPTITRELLKAGSTYTISCYQESAMSSNTRNTLILNKVGDPSITYYESMLPNYHLAKGLHTLTVTIQSTGLYDVVFWGHSLASTTVYSNFQIELGSEATDYHAYAGEIFNKQFEQEGEPVTVYGGKYNFTTGLLEITWTKRKIKSLGWYYDNSFQRFYATNPVDIKHPASDNDTPFILCDIYKPVAFSYFNSAQRPNSSISNPIANGRINIRDTRYTNIVSFVADVGEYYIAYEQAEPIYIELDEQIISALLGINNFYADTGNLTVIFVNDGQDETQTGAIVTFDLDESDLNKGDLANRLVSGNYANIRLKTGSNSIKFIGSVSAVGLDKYSRWL